MPNDTELIAAVAEKLEWNKHIFLEGLAYQTTDGTPFPITELPSTDACLALLDENRFMIQVIHDCGIWDIILTNQRGEIEVRSHAQSLPHAILLALLEVK